MRGGGREEEEEGPVAVAELEELEDGLGAGGLVEGEAGDGCGLPVLPHLRGEEVVDHEEGVEDQEEGDQEERMEEEDQEEGEVFTWRSWAPGLSRSSTVSLYTWTQGWWRRRGSHRKGMRIGS